MENNHKQEIIDVQDGTGKKEGFWQKIKSKINGMSKTQVILAAVAIVLVSNIAIMGASALMDRHDDLDDRLEQQLGYDVDDDDQVVVSQNNTSNSSTTTTANQTATAASQAAAAYGIALVETSELDGTYTATIFNETYTLTVKGNQATLQELEADGEQDIEQVIFDLDKKIAYVDGEAETYTFDGKTLVLTEVDNDLFDKDTITFTKQ
ncbi:DUF3642 domain-containing protein [Streptococcus oriscaviae]|uniref:DUF3642 domain-containing protein n=1 Tax=Streptococcus oriscaviae TaxID=2781599 RepID=A0ABX7YIS1_9STRE|nr:DUF3642 domain-containing protein [Streptococcus oriscaviae]QUE53650.1 hypothetical protein INT76_07350 [Streptococcus oriscaviae]